jgi:hypothetical protein
MVRLGSVLTYRLPKETSMIQTTPTPTLPAVPPQVVAFATEQAVMAYLPKVLEMTQRIFPGRPLAVRLVEDPKIANERHIVLELEVTGMDVPNWSPASGAGRARFSSTARPRRPGYSESAWCMDEHDFLALSRQLVRGTTQAEWRSAISRAYYAAIHVASRQSGRSIAAAEDWRLIGTVQESDLAWNHAGRAISFPLHGVIPLLFASLPMRFPPRPQFLSGLVEPFQGIVASFPTFEGPLLELQDNLDDLRNRLFFVLVHKVNRFAEDARKRIPLQLKPARGNVLVFAVIRFSVQKLKSEP